MKLITAFLISSACALAQTKPVADGHTVQPTSTQAPAPTPATPAKPSQPAPTITDAEKVQYWKFRALLAEAQIRQNALQEKSNGIADTLSKKCPGVDFDGSMDIVCPAAPVTPAPKQGK